MRTLDAPRISPEITTESHEQMKITYTPNPLHTVVELDDHDRAVLRLKLEVDDLTERIFEAHYAFKHLTPPDHERAKKAVDCDWMDGEASRKREARLDEMVAYYEGELRSQHVGDCTCVACSCDKCRAEDLLGINTINGLGKHPGSKIADAFGRDNERTIDEALERLRTYDPQPPTDTTGWDKVGGFEKHVPRWKEEAKAAYEWLLQYRAERYAPPA